MFCGAPNKNKECQEEEIMKKKVAAVVCMTILAVSLASCGNNETSAKNEKNKQQIRNQREKL